MNRWKRILCILSLPLATAAAAPGLINYQGRLTDSGGVPVTSPTNVTFTFWDTTSGGVQLGTGFSDTDSVTPDAHGLYATEIGDDPGNLVPKAIFNNNAVWLNVNVGGEDLVPRLRVTSAAYVSDAQTLQGIDAAGFLKMSADAFVIVRTSASEIQNGTNLLAAYTAAKLLTPHGAALSDTNRASVVVPPGRYDLGIGSLTLNVSFVDLVGLTSARENQFIYSSRNTLAQTALGPDVHIENLTFHCTSEFTSYYAYRPTGGSPATTLIRSCSFTAVTRTMLEGVAYDGTYEDCVTGDYAFGAGGTAGGTFINCRCGEIAFGAFGTASGTFTNCKAGGFSFAGGSYSSSAVASGTFTNCEGGYASFAGLFGTASGTFSNCSGESYSFAGNGGTASGIFTDCKGADLSFGGYEGGTASGTFTNCTGDIHSFGGYGGTASGSFNHCTGGNWSFGATGAIPGNASGGKFHHCTGGEDSFTELGAITPVHLFCVKNNAQYSREQLR